MAKVMKFLHGTSWENAKQIYRNGFIESDDGLLGPGVYVAREDKALKFARDTHRHQGTEGGLIEVLVTTNNPKYVTFDDKTWRSEGYDACRADQTSSSNNMEWCVSHRDQLKVLLL